MLIKKGSFGVLNVLEDSGMKVIKKQCINTASIDSINNEIKILLTLKGSMRIMKILEWKKSRFAPYFTMPYYPLGDLKAFIYEDCDATDYQNKVEMYSNQLISVIVYIHERNIAHLDIKPHNVLLSSEGIILADFGSAIEGVHSSREYLLVGSISYASPESIEEGTIIPAKCDYWALGATLYELNFREMLFPQGPVQDCERYREFERIGIQSLLGELSSHRFFPTLKKALELNPDNRELFVPQSEFVSEIAVV